MSIYVCIFPELASVLLSYLAFFLISSISLGVFSFYAENRFENLVIVQNHTEIYSLPNLNYKQNNITKNSIVYMIEKPVEGFSKVLYEGKIYYIQSKAITEGKSRLLQD